MNKEAKEENMVKCSSKMKMNEEKGNGSKADE